MSPNEAGRLVILSGPSCVGKSPLYKSLGKFYPELCNQFHKLVLVNSRTPRPGELDGVDYHFRTRTQVDALREDNRYAVVEARSDLHALDVQELESLLRRGDASSRETHLWAGHCRRTLASRVLTDSVFSLAAIEGREIAYLKAPERNVSLQELLTDIMRRKLLRRTRCQKGDLSAKDLENVETRASSAYRELQEAWHFQYVIPNHDGEDSDNWEAFYYLIGDARKTLDAFVALLKGFVHPGVEKWDEDLLPSES